MKSMTRTTGALAIALLSTTAASRADDVQAAAAKVFAEQKGHTISMSVTRSAAAKMSPSTPRACRSTARGLWSRP